MANGKKTKVYLCEHYEYEYDDLGKYCWCHNHEIPKRECDVDYIYCQQFCPGYKKGQLHGEWEISNHDKEMAQEYQGGASQAYEADSGELLEAFRNTNK